MKEHPSWDKYFQLEIYPQLKNVDRDFARLLKEGIQLQEGGELDFCLAKIHIFPDTTILETVNSQDLYLSVESGQSLPGERQILEEANFFYHIRPNLKDIISVVRYFVNSRIESKKVEILSHSLESLKFLSEKTLQEDLEKQMLEICYEVASFADICEALNAFFYEKKWNLLLCHEAEVFAHQKQFVVFFPLPGNGIESLFLGVGESILNEPFISGLYGALVGWCDFHFSATSQENELKIWQEILNKIEYPVVLMGPVGDLINYNLSYIKLKLSPRECLEFKNTEQLKIAHVLYEVDRKEIYPGQILISFYPVEQRRETSANATTTELGIISSSIAHELNNPLGGILAALNVLELDEWPPECEDEIRQMKEGVHRCKKLVETFLGFSRFSITNNKGDNKDLEEAFGQAMDLMRFRILENNVKIESRIQSRRQMLNQFNSSMMTMFFYIIAGEVFTAFCHKRLIDTELPAKIDLSCLLDGDYMLIDWGLDLDITQALQQSKLLNHIAQTQAMKLDIENQKLKLAYTIL